MNDQKPSYEELRERLERAEATLEALGQGQVDLLQEPLVAQFKSIVEEIRRRNEDLLLMNAINDAANRGESLASIINLVSTETKRIFSGNGITLYLLDKERNALVMQNLNISPDLQAKIEKLIGRPIPPIVHDLRKAHPYRQVLESRRGLLLTEEEQIRKLVAAFLEAAPWTAGIRRHIERFIPVLIALLGYKSVMAVPLLSGDELIGVLDMGSRHLFTGGDLDRMETIARQLTTVIQRKRAEAQLAEQLDELRRWHQASVSREMRIIELKREVNELSRRLGEPVRYPSVEKDPHSPVDP